MRPINTTPSHRPLCPNHGVPLDGIGFPIPAKGEGQCPVSGVMFAFEVDIQEGEQEMIKDKSGNLKPKPGDWKVTGND